MAELVAEHERLGRHHARAVGDDLAPSRRTAARSAAPGTGSSAGRCSARPERAARSRGCVTGSGAVALTGPLQRSSVERARSIIPTRSSRWIHGHVLPPARDRAADAERETAAASSPSAPPSRSSTTPVRTRTTRMPERRGLRASASHSTHTSREEVAPGRRVLVQRLLAVRAVVADRRGADQRARARLGAARAPRAGCACRSRGCRGSPAWRSALQRWATFSPARCTTASRPASAAAGAGSLEQVPATASTGDPAPSRSARALGVAREHRHLVAALRCSAATSAVPISPVAPVTVTRIALHAPQPSHIGARSAGVAPTTLGVIVSPGAKPTSWPGERGAARRAPRSATAAATAGATSRLKTDGMM